MPPYEDRPGRAPAAGAAITSTRRFQVPDLDRRGICPGHPRKGTIPCSPTTRRVRVAAPAAAGPGATGSTARRAAEDLTDMTSRHLLTLSLAAAIVPVIIAADGSDWPHHDHDLG